MMLTRQAIQAAEQLCTLPAIPTHNWATQTADALSPLSSNGCVGVLVTHIDEHTQSLRPISTGVSYKSSTDNTPGANIYYIKDKLERINRLSLQLPKDTLTRGLVAPLSLLHQHWRESELGAIFSSQGLPQNAQSPVICILPISHTHPGLALICILSMDSDGPVSDTQSINDTTNTLAAFAPMISRKAHVALNQVVNPKAWLTDREYEILEQLIDGNSVRVIADNLSRSAHTVHDHVKNLHKKLGASSRGELIAKALGHTQKNFSVHTPTPDPLVLTGAPLLAELKPNQTPAQYTQARPVATALRASWPQDKAT